MKNLRKIGITSCNQCSAELPDSGFRAAGVFLHPRADAAGILQTVIYVDYYCAKCSFAGRYEMHPRRRRTP